MAMTPLQALVLGLVEGVTEYLPVSSTGHLIIASSLMGLDDTPTSKAAVDTFNVVIQGGAILAVLGLYFPRILRMARGVFGRDPEGLALAVRIILAFLPAGVLGVLLADEIERRLFNTPSVLAALALGGVFMIVLDAARMKRFRAAGDDDRLGPDLHEMSLVQALLIGLLQCVAMIPGTSRSMMTIAGGVLVGLHPRRAAEFSFLLGLPTLGAATVYKLYKNLSHSAKAGTPNLFEELGWVAVILGIVVAAVSAAAAVKWLVSFLNRHGLTPFGVYRIVLCLVLLSLVTAGIVRISPEATVADAADPGTPAVEGAS